MKLATRHNGTLDGELFVVSTDLQHTASAASIVPSLRQALETWDAVEHPLQTLSGLLNKGEAPATEPFDPLTCLAPLPRAPQWLDASAFPTHGERMVQAFGLSNKTLGLPYPLMYQGCSDNFLGAGIAMPLPDESHGIDIEGELAVFTSHVPMAADATQATACIRLVALVDDVSLRNLLFAEMSMGFGMIHCKPTSVFSPVCVTPDELGSAWSPHGLDLTMSIYINGELLGRLSTNEMGFTFGQLIAHAARTRSLAAGTILGSGTLSNTDRTRGCACLAEKRALEMIDNGSIQTQWLNFGDRVPIEVLDADGNSIFGAIDHTFRQA